MKPSVPSSKSRTTSTTQKTTTNKTTNKTTTTTTNKIPTTTNKITTKTTPTKITPTPSTRASTISSVNKTTTPRISSGTNNKTTQLNNKPPQLSKSLSSPKSSASKSSPIIAKWDKGTKTVRQQILISFLTTHKKQDNVNLVDEYGLGASLFLARLIASLRITFNEGLSTSQLLRGIGVFIKSGVELFLVDFVESGSLSTVLDLLIHSEVSEDDKQDALELMSKT